MLTNWIRTQPRYDWDWDCYACKKSFSSKYPYRVRSIDVGHGYKWCENCYQRLIKKLQKLKEEKK